MEAAAIQQQKVRLSTKQGRAWRHLEDDDPTTELFYGGAAGGGKSMLGCLFQIARRTTYAGSRGLIGRQILKDLKESTLITYFRVCKMLDYHAGRDYEYNSTAGTITWANNSVNVLKGLKFDPSDPEFEDLGSTEYTDAFIDEGSGIVEKAFEIVTSRVRFLSPFGLKTPKVLICSNPVDNWQKTRFISDDHGNPVVLKPYQKYVPALLSDNPDPEFQTIYRQQLEKLSEYDRARLLHGDWDARPRTGMEYYHPFDRAKHVGQPVFIPNQAVHITFDFNVAPFMTLLVIQLENADGAWFINVLDEFCLPHPFNSTEAVCQKFAESELFRKAKALYFYGDYSGKKRETVSPDNNFSVVERVLRRKLSNTSDRVIKNQPILDRKLFMNDSLAGKTPLRFRISPNCIQLIKELNFMKEAPDGTKLKERVRDPITLANFERWGHPSDALEYFVTSVFYDYFRTYVSRR